MVNAETVHDSEAVGSLSRTRGFAAFAKNRRLVFFVLVIAFVIGLAVGLGVGLGVKREGSTRFHHGTFSLVVPC